MRELASLDQVAYIRFASVYKSFQDVNEFRAVIDDLEGGNLSGQLSSK
jgi:transcriptional repressor NrdR